MAKVVDPTRTLPNPERRALDKDIRKARLEVTKLEQAYGAAAIDNPEVQRPTMRGFKSAHGKLGKELRAARDNLAALVSRRRSLPERIEVRDLSDGALVKLATERKHITNLIKMVAFQAESDLLTSLRPYYARSEDEGRTLLQELFQAAGDIHVTQDQLCITVHPLSSPHRTLAVQAYATPLPKPKRFSQELGSNCALPSIRGHSWDWHSPALATSVFPQSHPLLPHETGHFTPGVCQVVWIRNIFIVIRNNEYG